MLDHGGRRKGAGRKKANPSKRITVPYELIETVEQLILDFKSKNQEESPLLENPPKNQKSTKPIQRGKRLERVSAMPKEPMREATLTPYKNQNETKIYSQKEFDSLNRKKRRGVQKLIKQKKVKII